MTGGGNGGAVTGRYGLKGGKGAVPIGSIMVKGVA